MALLCGESVLDPNKVVERLKFSGFPRGSGTPEALKEIVGAMEEAQLR